MLLQLALLYSYSKKEIGSLKVFHTNDALFTEEQCSKCTYIEDHFTKIFSNSVRIIKN